MNCTHAETIKIEGFEATCTKDGLTDGIKCSKCEEILTAQQAIPALGHTSSDWIVDEQATCTEEGSQHKECTVCGEALETEAIPANGHSYTSVITAPTCEEQGYTTHTCDNCGDSYVDTYIEATGHTVSDWIEDIPA